MPVKLVALDAVYIVYCGNWKLYTMLRSVIYWDIFNYSAEDVCRIYLVEEKHHGKTTFQYRTETCMHLHMTAAYTFSDLILLLLRNSVIFVLLYCH
jgi:hypothetical protein